MNQVENILVRFLGQNTKYEKRDGSYESNLTLEDFVGWNEMSFRDLTPALNRLLKAGFINQEEHPLKTMRILTLTSRGAHHFESDIAGYPNPKIKDLTAIVKKVQRINVTSRTNWVILEMKDGSKLFLPEKLVTIELLELTIYAIFTRNEFMDLDFKFHEVDVETNEDLQPNKEQMKIHLDNYYGDK